MFPFLYFVFIFFLFIFDRSTRLRAYAQTQVRWDIDIPTTISSIILLHLKKNKIKQKSQEGMCQIKACLRRLSHSSIVFWLSTVQREKKCCSNYLSIISDRIFLITYMNCCWHSFDNWFAAGPALNRNSLQIFIPSVFFFPIYWSFILIGNDTFFPHGCCRIN